MESLIETPSKRIEILLVEDSETDRMLTLEALRSSRIRNTVHCVEDGDKAMKFLRQEEPYEKAPAPDLILLDLNLPRKDGREVLTEVKSDEFFRYIPVVVLTTSQADEDILGAYGVHANCYITKPIDFNQFSKVVATLESFWFEVVTLPSARFKSDPGSGNSGDVFSVPPVRRVSGDSKYKPLIVEDVSGDAPSLQEALSRCTEGEFEIVTASNMTEAKQRSETGKFDVIIGDWALSDSPGVSILRSFEEFAPGIPVVAVLPSDAPDLVLEVLKEGAADYVSREDIQGTSLLSRAIRYVVDRRRIEEQMRHAQRMESLGVLAGGIAHDFNNLLMVVRGNAELQGRLPAGSPKLARTSQQILSAADRAASLTRQLLSFSRRERLHLNKLNCNDMLEEFSRMIQRLLGQTVELTLKLTDEPLEVMGDPSLLQQVIMNFAVNSRDAMPDGGELVIQTEAFEISPERREGVPPAGPGSYMKMSLTDTGSGMPPDVVERIFEPFFTTKEVGRGTGLGLSTAFGIVQQHRGVIEVQSEIGVGTTFTVLIPRSVAGEVADGEVFDKIPVGKGETVLVVEDDVMVRDLTVSFLEMHGYQVIPAETGLEVMNRWGEIESQVDLVLTDMIMPHGVSGHDLGTWLYEQDAQIKVIYCSGYSQPNLKRRFKLREGQNFLSKPFTAHGLLSMVSRVLESESTPGSPR
ncbi:MAG: hypothetical protein SynsKO_17860 [Synoicihabitans sp.]